MVAKFFLFSNAFLQYFLFVKRTIVFLLAVLQYDLPILWQASKSLILISPSTSFIISLTVLSKSLSLVSSGMPEMMMLFLLPCCSTWLIDDSKRLLYFLTCYSLHGVVHFHPVIFYNYIFLSLSFHLQLILLQLLIVIFSDKLLCKSAIASSNDVFFATSGVMIMGWHHKIIEENEQMKYVPYHLIIFIIIINRIKWASTMISAITSYIYQLHHLDYGELV